VAQNSIVWESLQTPVAGTPLQGSAWQLFVLAKQLWPEAQEVATERLRQPLASAVQVRTLLPEHCVAPACEQVLLQATQADPLQYFPEPHEVAAERVKHPFESAAHVCTCDPEHWVAPASKQVLLQLCFEPPHESRTAPDPRATRTTFMASPQGHFIAPK